MRWVLAAMTLVTVPPFLILAKLLRALRRAGHRDRGSERMVAWWLAAVAVSSLITLACPSPPLWFRYVLLGPPLVVGFGFLAARIRRHPEALFSPSTLRRRRACKGHR